MSSPFVTTQRNGKVVTIRLHRFIVNGKEWYLDFTRDCGDEFSACLVADAVCKYGHEYRDRYREEGRQIERTDAECERRNEARRKRRKASR